MKMCLLSTQSITHCTLDGIFWFEWLSVKHQHLKIFFLHFYFSVDNSIRIFESVLFEPKVAQPRCLVLLLFMSSVVLKKKKKSLRGQKRKRIIECVLGLLGWEAGRRILKYSRQKPEWALGLPSEMQSRLWPASGGARGSPCRTDGELLWETFQPRAALKGWGLLRSARLLAASGLTVWAARSGGPGSLRRWLGVSEPQGSGWRAGSWLHGRRPRSGHSSKVASLGFCLYYPTAFSSPDLGLLLKIIRNAVCASYLR